MADVTDALETPEKESDNRTLGRIALLLFLTGVLLLLSWLGWKAWRVYQTSASLLERQAQFEELAAGGLQEVDPDALEILVLGTYGDIRTLRAETSFLMPVLPYLKNVPQIGPLAAAAPHLLEMADAGMEAAAYGIRAMKPVLAAAQSEEPILPLLLQTTQSAQGDLAQTALALERTAEARSQLSIIEGLPWRVETLLEKGDTWLPLGQDFTRLALALPELMGLNGPRRYLIMAQNQDELRPTGGFISGAGFLEIEDGEIKRLDFMDANVVDAWEEPGKVGGALAKPYDAPPQPLHDFMLLGLFLFRDANFWPDFAVSGQKAMDFYAYGRDVEPLDGVMALTRSRSDCCLPAWVQSPFLIPARL